MTEPDKIPSRVIGVLGEVFSDYYTHAEIERQFAYAEAPGEPPEGNKVQKTMEWLRRINKECSDPLSVLGDLIEDLMERDPPDIYPWHTTDQKKYSDEFVARRERVEKSLAKSGFLYAEGGNISVRGVSATTSLTERVEKSGLSAVKIEIDRALAVLEKDPNAGAQYAANVLEATFKAYLSRKGLVFDDASHGLNDLWQRVRDDLGINPKDLGSKDLKKIASGMNQIVEGTMFVRNKISGAHGKSEAAHKETLLRPRHARFVVHSAHTLAAYVLECLDS